MTKSELIALAEKCEAYSVDDSQGKLLSEVGLALISDVIDRGVFSAWVNSGAYLSAAEMLVPEGFMWRVGHDGEGPNPADFKAEIMADDIFCRSRASTSALSLAATSLRAKAGEM